jgi:2-methylcitrate dehydratase PrpD
MKNHDEKLAVEELSENVLSTRFENLAPEIIENTKKRILDTIGCIIGGALARDNLALIDLIMDWGGKKEATILGYGVKAPAHIVAMANCILCRSFDWETLVVIVGHQRLPSHTSGTTVPTAISMGESKGISGRELITALVAGDDLAARIFAGTEHAWNRNENRLGGTQERRGGFEPWGTVTSFGAAAIAGRILGLNPFQLKNALGIVINLISGAGSGLNDGATTFKLSQGDSARNGILAANLAKGGWIGIDDPLTGKAGYYATFTSGCDHPEVLTENLGKKYYVEVIHKPYPGGRPTHTPITAAVNLVSKHDINMDDIAEVTLRLSAPMKYGHYMRPYKVGYYPTGDALFSYKFSTASALFRRNAVSKNYTEEFIRDPGLQSLISKVKFADSTRPEGVELELKMKDGKIISEYAAVATGELPNPLSWDELVDKFMAQVEFTRNISESSAKKLIGLAKRLEEVEDIREIVDLAVKMG